MTNIEIIRIPSGYHNQIKFLPDKDVAYIFKSLFAVANDEKIIAEESMRFGILSSIFRETTQMNNKARAKKKLKPLKIDLATLSRDEGVRPSNITSSNITSNNITKCEEKIHTQKKSEINSEEENIDDFGKESFGEFVKLYFNQKDKLIADCGSLDLFNEIIEELNIAIGCADKNTIKAKYSNHFYAFQKFLRTKKNSKSFKNKPPTDAELEAQINQQYEAAFKNKKY